MKAKEIAYIGINTALMIICSWISVPAAVPFTLQTFAVFLIADLFTLKISMWSMMVYLLLGLMGFPAFSGMKGGISVLMGPTGGYIIGFVFSVLFVEKLKKPDSLMGLLICTPFPGQPGKGVLLCAIHMSLKENVLNCIGREDGLKHQ